MNRPTTDYGKIPALVSSGGNVKYDSKDIVEYRVWVHPQGKSDYYYNAKTWKKIIAIRKITIKLNEGFVEIPLGVIKDSTSPHGFREVVLTGVKV